MNHPMLVAVPIGSWLAAAARDATGGSSTAALNDLAVVLFGASWLARRRQRTIVATMLSSVGAAHGSA